MKKINHYQGDTLDFHKDVVNSKRNTADDKNKKIVWLHFYRHLVKLLLIMMINLQGTL